MNDRHPHGSKEPEAVAEVVRAYWRLTSKLKLLGGVKEGEHNDD